MTDAYFTAALAAIAAFVVVLLAVTNAAPWPVVIVYWIVLTVKNVHDYVKLIKKEERKN